MTLITGQTLPSKFEEIPNFVNNAFTNYQNVILFLCDALGWKFFKKGKKTNTFFYLTPIPSYTKPSSRNSLPS